MLAKEIESKIVAAITAALPASAPKSQILGAWQPSTAGYVKNKEDADTVAVIAVALGTFSREVFSAPTGSFNGAVTLVVRTERDATGTSLVTFADAIEALFATWQGQTYQQAFTALDVTGFSVGNFSVSGGQPPSLDLASGTVTVSWSFTISGVETSSSSATSSSSSDTSSSSSDTSSSSSSSTSDSSSPPL